MDKKELNMNEMENVTGGVRCTVNTGIPGVDAALRADSRKSSRQVGHLPNGTMVDVRPETIVRDAESGRNFVQVSVNGKDYWIAASLVGLPR